MDTSSTLPSKADHPDLDWSQVRETVMLLHLAVAQIDRSMHDGDDSVQTLTDSFTTMAGKAQVINSAAGQFPAGRERDTVLENCQAIELSMGQAIVAFQFYDKLSQRLAHISNSLEDLAELVSNPARLYNPYEWHGLQRKIRSKYTNESDRHMFDAILAGATIEEALAKADPKPDNEIELF